MELYIEKQLADVGVIPVVCLENTKDAGCLAHALADGGLPAAEVTFRADGAAKVIAAMREVRPEMLVGAGTVLTLDQARSARDAGAAFIVSPGLDEEIVSWCLEEGIPVLPGCVTPTEVMKAKKLGLELVKFFPAGQYGGRKTLEAFHGPFPDMRFMPTGGVTLENLQAYLELPYIPACGGTFMVRNQLLQSGNWEQVQKESAQAAALVASLRKNEG